MNPYESVGDIARDSRSHLALCAGIGAELQWVKSQTIVAVDIVPEYLDKLKQEYPKVRIVHADALDYLKSLSAQAFDTISLIDAIEHFTKAKGLKLLKEAKRAGRAVIIYTPEGYVKNEPHHAWGIAAGDKYQRHLSGWTAKELEKLGFTLVRRAPAVSQHGEEHNAILMVCSQS